MSGPQGYDYRQVAERARKSGCLIINQYDQSPRSLRFRRAVYRAVKAGLLKRQKSPPSAAVYVPTQPPHTGATT